MEGTIPHLLERNAERTPDRTAYHDKLTGTWRSTTWGDFNTLTRRVGRAMITLGLGEGDVVAILSSNRPEWTVTALAAMRVGGISAGIYTTNSPAEVAYILNHAESALAAVENTAQLAKIQEKWDELPSLRNVILMEGADEDPRVLSWNEFIDKAEATPDSEVDDRMAQLRSDQVADFIYTSGTTGPPKAAMLTHENLAFTARTIADSIDTTSDEVMLSYLPLSHIAEQMASIHIAIERGYTIYYCHDGLQLADYLKEVRPTIFFGVPRVWGRFESVLTDQFSQASGPKAAILSWARGVGSKVTNLRNRGEEPNAVLDLQYKIADKLVFAKIREATGLSRHRVLVSGAAPTPPATLEFFGSLGMTIIEIYGQSEDSGPTSTNLPGAVKYGSVGKPFEGVEVKLSDGDEILVRGKNVFAGYYKDQAATAEAVIDGWLQSGDLGRFDEDGYLYITGRSKDIIITSGGKNIAPRNLEEALTALHLISQAVCVGEQQRYLIALVTLDPEASKRYAHEHGLDVAGLPSDPTLRAELEKQITEEVNSHFARVEHIRNFVILPRDFSVETGEMTPTFKIKRSVVNEMYASEIDAAYSAGQVL